MPPDRPPAFAPVPTGVLVAVVGPSGAGKDTLIRLALAGLGPDAPVRLARRVITRPAAPGAEDHDSLDAAGFARAAASGAFCLVWNAHGLRYGLPRRIEADLSSGRLVVANLSRRSVGEALRRFSRVAVAEVTAPPAVLVARVAARGREAPEAVAARLARRVEFAPPPGLVGFVSIDNAGPPMVGAERLGRFLASLAAPGKGPA